MPSSFLERISGSPGIKTFETGAERRTSVRVPLSYKGDFLTTDHDRIGDVYSARIKDVSVTGVGLLLAVETRVTAEFVLGMCPRGHGTHWLLCKVRRAEIFDGICLVVGASWEKVLYPGQEVQPGLKVSTLLWMNVTGEDTVADPFLETGAPAEGTITPIMGRR